MISRPFAALAAAIVLTAACATTDRTPEVLSEVNTPPAGPDAEPSGAPSPSPSTRGPEQPDGPAPEPEVDEPVSEAAIAAAVAQRRGELCIDPDESSEHDHATFVLDDAVVVAVRCFTGAYQSEWTLTGYDGTQGVFDLERVEQWDTELRGLVDSASVFGTLELDDAGRLVGLSLDRGIGDCGKVQRWYAHGDALILASAEAQDCETADGTTHEQGWPTVYPGGD